jgi:glycosyltransferase involved in cell wall biosynthesis
MRNPEPPRRVLVISHTHPRLTQGGGEIAAFETFRRLDVSPDFETWWLSHDAGRLPLRAGAPITQPFGPREYLYSGRSYDPFLFANPDPNFAPALIELLTRLQPDVVHFHHFAGIGVEAMAIVRRVVPPARVILTLHEYLLICHHYGQMVTRPELALCEMGSPQACHRCFPEETPQAFFLRGLWLRRHLDAVDLFIAPSRFLRDRFLAWGLPAERLQVMENPLPPMPALASRPAKLPSVTRIGYFGQISELKGLGVLFSAARLLADRGWQGVIDVHGKVETMPEGLQRRLDLLLSDIPSNVALRGHYANAHVGRLMMECDAVVVPSIWWENSPLVVREAAAAGVPIIGADIGGLGEKLRETPGSILARARDPIALAQAIMDLPARRSEPANKPRAHKTRRDIENANCPAWVDPLSLYLPAALGE